MARRCFVTGFEGGTNFYGSANTPSDGNVTVQSTTKRTGTYALRCNIQSATKSSLTLAFFNASNIFNGFFRGYFNFTSFPSTTRTFIANSATVAANRPELRITSGGLISMGNNGTMLATGATALSTGTWYCIEWGLDTTNGQGSVRINGVDEIAWTAYTAGTPTGAFTPVIGTADTGTGAYEFFVDDVSCDIERWCGTGAVYLLSPSAVNTDNAHWTANTGTKIAAVQAIDDDTTYIVSDATTGSGSRIQFDVDDLPGGIQEVYGTAAYVRIKRDGASNGSIQPAWVNGGFSENVPSAGLITSTSAYAWGVLEATSFTPLGYETSQAHINSLAVGFEAFSANPTRISAIFVEVDAATASSARPHPRRAFVASCDTGDVTEFDATGGTAPAASTNQVRTGTYSIRCNPASTATSEVHVSLSAFGTATMRQIFGRMYLWVATLPNATKSQAIAMVASANSSRIIYVAIAADGSIGLCDSTSGATNTFIGTASAAGTITTGSWINVEWWFQASTTSSSSDGQGKVWVNGVEVASSTGLKMTVTSMTGNQWFGIMLNTATVTTDLYLDDIVLDYGNRIRESKVLDMVPTAVGTDAGANWTIGAGASKTAAVSETPTDDDTSYILSPLSTSAAESISFAMTDLPAAATVVHMVRTRIRHRSDGIAFSAVFSIRAGGQIPATTSYTANTSYGWRTDYFNITGTVGEWTTGLYNAAEIYFKPSSATVKQRISNARFTVEYVETSVGNKEVNGTGIVLGEAVAREVTATGTMTVADNTRSLTANAIVVDTGLTKQVTASGIIGGTKSRDLPCDAILATNSGTIVHVKKAQVTGSGYVTDITPPTAIRTLIADGVVTDADVVITLPDRLYFSNSLPTVQLSQRRGDWDDIRYTQNKRLSSSKLGSQTSSTLADQQLGENATLMYAFLSDPIAATTIQGSIALTLPMRETSGVAVVSLQIYMWVTQGDTDSLRGVLLDTTIDTHEWPTTPAGVTITPLDMTSVTAQAGDRVVIEIGPAFRDGESRNGQIYIGGSTLADSTNAGSFSSIGWIDIALPFIGTDPTIQEFAVDVDGTGLVQDTKTVEVTGTGIVKVSDNTVDVTGTGIMQVTGNVKQVTGAALIGLTKSQDWTADALLIDTGGTLLYTDTLDVKTSGYVDDGLAPADSTISLPTKIYFGNSQPTVPVATPQGTWTETSFVKIGRLATTKLGTQTSATLADTVIGNNTTLTYMLLSDPLTAIMLSGTLNMIVPMRETAGNGTAALQLYIWVTQGNTTNVRGVLLAPTVVTREWPTVPAGIAINAQTLSRLAIQEGDRLVVEMGPSFRDGEGRTGQIFLGGDTLPDSADAGTSTSIGWLTITLPGYRELDASGLVLATQTAEVTGTGLVQATQTAEVTSDAIVDPGVVTQTKEVTASANLAAAVATRLYLMNVAPIWTGSVSTAAGTWSAINFLKMQMSEDNTVMGAATSRAITENAAGSTTRGVMMFASPPLKGAQTIAGMLDFVIGTMESSLSADMYPRLHVYVTAGSTNTVRGTLLSNWEETGNEMPIASMGQAPFGQIPLTSVAAQDGDYIVMEIGYRAANTSSTGFTGRIFYGGTNGGSDLTAGNSNVGTLLGWVGFSQDIAFTYQGRFKEVTATGIVNAPVTKDVTGTGIIRDTKTQDVTATGIIRDTRTLETTATGVITQVDINEVTATGIIVATQTTEITAAAIIFATQSLASTATAILQDTRSIELSTEAVLQDTFTHELDAAAILQDTITLETTATALLQQTVTLETTADADVFATEVAELSADALLIGRPGTVKARAKIINELELHHGVLPAISTSPRVVAEITAHPKIYEGDQL